MFDGFDPQKAPYDPTEALDEKRDKELFWEDQPVPVLTPEQLRAVEYRQSRNPQDAHTFESLMAGLTKIERDQVQFEKERRLHLPPVLNPKQLQALERLEQVRKDHSEKVNAKLTVGVDAPYDVERAALAGLTDREQQDVREVAERRIWRWLEENNPIRLAQQRLKARTPEQVEADRKATKVRDAEMARWVNREARAWAEQERRAPDVDPRYGEASPWPPPVALTRTGQEKLFRVFAEARGKVVRVHGAQLQAGWLVYSVWANTLRHAFFLAAQEVFAAGPGEPGVRSISNGDNGTTVQEAPYLERRKSG